MKRETVRAMKELAYYSSLGLQVALSIFIGLFFGRWLDGVFGTSPLWMMVFLGFGIAAGFKNILLALKKSRSL
ncbi:AtpZ/AtpI family protein [Desulfatiferula olefinivorans]